LLRQKSWWSEQFVEIAQMVIPKARFAQGIRFYLGNRVKSRSLAALGMTTTALVPQTVKTAATKTLLLCFALAQPTL
jgi:hypothetical protein